MKYLLTSNGNLLDTNSKLFLSQEGEFLRNTTQEEIDFLRPKMLEIEVKNQQWEIPIVSKWELFHEEESNKKTYKDKYYWNTYGFFVRTVNNQKQYAVLRKCQQSSAAFQYTDDGHFDQHFLVNTLEDVEGKVYFHERGYNRREERNTTLLQISDMHVAKLTKDEFIHYEIKQEAPSKEVILKRLKALQKIGVKVKH